MTQVAVPLFKTRRRVTSGGMLPEVFNTDGGLGRDIACSDPVQCQSDLIKCSGKVFNHI